MRPEDVNFYPMKVAVTDTTGGHDRDDMVMPDVLEHPTVPVAVAAARRRESVGLAFFWLVVLAYGFFVPDVINWNTESHLYPAFSLVDHHTVNIDAYQQGLGDKAFYRGHYYSDKAPGLSFLAVPVYAAMRLIFPDSKVRGFLLYRHIQGYYYIPPNLTYVRYGITYLVVALPSAALALMLWLFLARLSRKDGPALAVASTYALGTVAYIYSVWYFSHQATAILLFCAFLLLFYAVRDRLWTLRVMMAAAGAGLLAGFSVISEFPTVVIALALAVYLLGVTPHRLRTAAAFFVGMMPAAALELWYNVAAFGRPFANGYMYVYLEAYRNPVRSGPLGWADPLSYATQLPTLESVWGITLSPFRGIFFVSPVLLLFVPGAYWMWRRLDLRREWWLCVGVVVLYFLIDAARGPDVNGWAGGTSVASRHLTPIVPFMMVPLVFALRSSWSRLVFAVLAALSITVMFMTVSATYLYQYPDKNPIFNEALHNFLRGHILPNWVSTWGSGIGLTGLTTLLPLVLIAIVLVAWMVRDLRAESA